MKSYFKVITNIFLTSISLSVLLGSLLRIIGPINHNNKTTRTINLVGKSRRSIEKEIKNKNSNLLSFYNNKLDKFQSLEELINKWENLIIKNPDLYVSCFFISLDNKVYAEIKSDIRLAAASSIKVPILIVLLTMLDRGEILWNEKLILTEDTIGSGSGWMAFQKIGQEFPVFEVASEMIRVSDNTATNLLIKRLGGIDKVNQKFKEIGLKNTKINNFLPDLSGTNLTSTKDLSLAMALVDGGYLLKTDSRDIYREIMQKSKTNTLIPTGILRGLEKKTQDTDYHLSLRGYLVLNKTGDIGISYSDTALIQTPYKSKAFASFIVKGPFNDPRSPELIRNLSAELVPFLQQDQKPTKTN
ncbi:serine hydrolase [Prochlorococcus marinus]|uniref:Serine hydrolase n=1 Tax=Prochlorococcus marinus XMU1408 TaxID=2213228 RepID=A0A318R370_PROMR|nr:serine hydrolase [Prochlorococcus marinus]MBW3042304.1 serine hydrolase [Prochlorococcus marinus str. XMU1408]PYE01690.1 serine hydrolase [Prochlorococcus marinus XMU1408]